MPTFTVHQPPLRDGQSAADPLRFVFVRDGFHFWAFVLAPVWLLVHKLWLVFALYVVLNVALALGFALIGVPPAARLIAGILIGLLVGLEAATLWRWTLSRRGWKTVGTVVAENEETAERRFFSAWTESEQARPVQPAGPSYAAPVKRGRPSA